MAVAQGAEGVNANRLALLFLSFFRTYRICSRCGYPYRDDDLVSAGVNRFLCRWHWTYHREA